MALYKIFCCMLLILMVVAAAVEEKPTTFIVRMDKTLMPTAFTTHSPWYASTLATVQKQANQDSLLHVYNVVFHGFAAKMTPSQASVMEQYPEVISIFPDTIARLQTTHSPEFLHLQSSVGIWPESDYGSDVVVGIFDTGIWPESASFSDEGMGPVPSHWQGACSAGDAFNASSCNRKIVGARIFYAGYEALNGPINRTAEIKSVRDSDGHGTHTASTAAGRAVQNASLFGFAKGTAQGMAPKARIAAYKTCWLNGCSGADILAAFDEAVKDGVDVISLSLGQDGGTLPYYLDPIALGAFGAMERGVFVATAAGNQGPSEFSVANVAPWLTTVGASTMDRSFPADVVLGNGDLIPGISLYSPPHGLSEQDEYPLMASSDAALGNNGTSSFVANLCKAGSLDPSLVRGKIVLCERGENSRVEKGAVVKAGGGAGMILANSASDGEGLIADCHLLPATAVGAKSGVIIRKYIHSNKLSTARFSFHGTRLGISPAPVVASFSSRGPNPETPEIMKPDLVAPGVDVLAAWTDLSGPSAMASDPRRVKFNIISGTSMACPHVSGLAALLKGAHPSWTPSAIRSALMTTAYLTDSTTHVMTDEATGKLSTPFDFGSGHVDPQKALHPGLLYDLTTHDYIAFLCSLNYSKQASRMVTRQAVSCPHKPGNPGDLNYPSLSAVFDQSSSLVPLRTFTRIVTNVGNAMSVYTVQVLAPRGVRITVKPTKLAFTRLEQKLSYRVKVKTERLPLGAGESETVFGLITWTDGSHVVQSPIAITRQEPY